MEFDFFLMFHWKANCFWNEWWTWHLLKTNKRWTWWLSEISCFRSVILVQKRFECAPSDIRKCSRKSQGSHSRKNDVHASWKYALRLMIGEKVSALPSVLQLRWARIRNQLKILQLCGLPITPTKDFRNSRNDSPTTQENRESLL